MLSKKKLKIIALSLSILLLESNAAVALDNEGLPASYGQSDIEQAKVPDPTKRQPTYGSGPQPSKSAGTVTTTKSGSGPNASQTTGMGTSSGQSSVPTVGSPSGSSNSPTPEIKKQEGAPIPSSVVKPASTTQMELEDETITQNLRARIASDPSVSSTTIIIMTQNGVVSLGGLVDTLAQKQAIEEYASTMAGVKAVNSRISVQRGATTPPINVYEPTLGPPPANP